MGRGVFAGDGCDGCTRRAGDYDLRGDQRVPEDVMRGSCWSARKQKSRRVSKDEGIVS